MAKLKNVVVQGLAATLLNVSNVHVYTMEYGDRLSYVEPNVGIVAGIGHKIQVTSVLRLVDCVVDCVPLHLLDGKASTMC